MPAEELRANGAAAHEGGEPTPAPMAGTHAGAGDSALVEDEENEAGIEAVVAALMMSGVFTYSCVIAVILRDTIAAPAKQPWTSNHTAHLHRSRPLRA